MLNKELNIYEYEEVLQGHKRDFQCSFKGSDRSNKIEVGNVWRYAVTHILKWDAKQAQKYLTDEIVDMLRLDKTFSGIGFDRLHSYIQDYRFILQYAFPGEINYDERTEAIDEYKKVCKLGEYSNDKDYYRYPKKFFSNDEGIRRANYLLEYAVNQYLSDMTIFELYEFFSNRKEAAAWLKEKNLDSPLKTIYDNPLEYLHFSLPQVKRSGLRFIRDENLYYNYSIAYISKEITRRKKRLKKAKSQLDLV